MTAGPAASVHTTCPYCGVGCGVVAKPDGTIAADPAHPANRGRLCSKGAALAATLDDRGRLTEPTVGGAAVDPARAGLGETWPKSVELGG